MNNKNELILGNALQMMDYFGNSEEVVDVIITSPPYWDRKNYGNIDGQIGYGQSKDVYLEDIRSILNYCYKVTKHTGSLWLVVDNYRRNGVLELLPLELGDIASNIGWKLRDLIIWDKQYSLPWHQKGQMRNTSEHVLFMTKSDDYKFEVDRIKNLDEISKWWIDFPERFNPKGKTPTNIWGFPILRRGNWPNPALIDHLCPFPTGLVTRIIELSTDEGDLVFDPFAGSGVVLAQAEVMKREYFGFEINPEYVNMFYSEVKQNVADEWEKLKKRRSIFDGAKRDFEKTIMNLRSLKYSRQVAKAFLEPLNEVEKEKVKAVICIAKIPESYQRGLYIDLQIWFIGDRNHRFFRKGLDNTQVRTKRPPLTQYAIKSNIFTGTYLTMVNNSQRDLSQDSFFYLYPLQNPRKYTDSGTLFSWFEENKINQFQNGSTPPMLSNVAEDVRWALGK